MTVDSAHLEHARKVADAVLYEGYLLYPYRRSAQKNRTRFQFGVLMPPPYRAVDEHEPSASQTECLIECPADAELDIGLRFLHLQRRTAQRIEPDTGAATDVDTLRIGETEHGSWDEAVEREEHFRGCVADLLDEDTELIFEFGESVVAENLRGPDGGWAGRLLRRCEALAGAIVVRPERTAGPYGVIRLRVRVENRSEPRVLLRTRDDGLKHAMIAAHLLIGAAGGTFLSMTDPPEWAAGEVAACVNAGTWPVLAGPAECHDLMLSSPVILYDHPEVAPESAGDLFDATEIDEILTLRTLALTDEERQEARAASEPPTFTEPAGAPPAQPWWDPGSDTSVSPETDHVLVGGVRVARGSRVRMRPGTRRADAQDIFLTGREALVEAVLHDVDGQVHVAVSPVRDPLADLQRHHGRFLYFAPDEIEPVPAGGGNGDDGDHGKEGTR